MNMFFEQFKSQQSSDNNYFKQEPQNDWLSQFMKEENINQNEVRANAKPKWDTHEGAININYKFTNYSVKQENMKQASSGLKWNDKTNRVNNNYIEHYDDEFGWVKCVAVNGDLLKQNGKNVWNSDLHNTILEVELDNGDKFLAGVYDHCGISTSKPVLDIWQYNSTDQNYNGNFTVKRKGGKTNYSKH